MRFPKGRIALPLLVISLPLFFPALLPSAPAIHPKYLEALALINTQQWGQAIQRAKELIRERPDLAVAYKTLVAASAGNKDLAGARRVIEDLLLQHPGRARLYYALALCLKEEGKYDPALEQLKKAIERDPRFADAFVEIAEVYGATKRLDQGIAFFKQYARSGAYRSNGYLGLARCYMIAADLNNPRRGPLRPEDVDNALGSLTEAITLDSENVTAYRLRSLIYFPLGDYENYLQACEAIERFGKADRDDELLYKNVGNLAMAYEHRNRRSQSIQRYTEALQLARAAGDQRQQVRYLHTIGTLRTGFVDNREALRSLEEALDLSRQLKKTDPGYGEFWEGWTLLRIGDVYYRLDNRAQAREHYQEALKLPNAIGQEGVAYATKGTGDLEYLIGEYDKAIPLFQDALKIIRALPEAARNRNEDWILSVLGLAYFRKKDYQTALRYFEEALALAEKSQDELRIEEKLGRMGATFLLRRAPGDLERALRYLSRARDLAENVGQKEHAGFWTTRLGDGYRELGRKQQALEQYAEARRLGETVNYSRIIREAAMGQGELLEREGDLKGALAAYDETIRILERERDQFLLEREKEAFFEDKLDVYERVVNLLLALYGRERDPKYLVQAFHYSERAKAQGFLQSVPQGQLLKYLKKTSEAYKDWNAGYEKEQNEIYQQLLNERAQLEAMIDRKEDDHKIKDRKNKIATLERERLDKSESAQLRFLNTMRERIPGLADLYKPKILDASSVQRLLGEHELLIDYHMQQENTVAFIIGKDRIERVRMPFGRDHREKLMKIIHQVNRTSVGERETEDDAVAKLRTLYEQVFASVAPYLKPDRELIIVRDDVLNYLPFGMLVPEAGGDRPRFLIERYPISYVDSASLLDSELWAERKKRGRPRLDLLALGSPDFGGKLPPLPHTEGEVQNIRPHFKHALVRTGSAATEAAFKSEAGRARLLHIATHGTLDAETAWHSKIEFALNPAIDQKGEDGHLYTYEIFNLDLVADLVVLSACQSGLGKLRPGEGLVGMSRAFLYAGAPSLVATLWSIPDTATSELMGKFYGYLMQGMNKRRALQRAQADLIQDGYTDPFYWAAFILIGDSSQIKITETSSPSLPIAVTLPIALLLLLASAIFLRKITTKRASH